MINVIEITSRFVVNPLPSKLFLSHNCGPNSTATGTATLPRSCEHDTRIHGSNLPQLQREDKQQKSEQLCPYLWVFKAPWFSNFENLVRKCPISESLGFDGKSQDCKLQAMCKNTLKLLVELYTEKNKENIDEIPRFH